MGTKEKLSRRGFLATAGKLAAGASVGAAGLSLVTGSKVASSAAVDIPEWPWPYKKLDPEAVYWKGVEGYKRAACSEGAFWAITNELGFPYTLVPPGMLKWGEGGGVGWGSHCGALIGASSAIALVHKDSKVYTNLIKELTGWYTEFLGSGSPLCHVSVTEWAKQNGVKVESQERKDRCARLTGEVAKKAAELLNLQADGQFQPLFGPRWSAVQCHSCHGKDGMNDVRAGVIQDCVPCHGDPHKGAGRG